MAQTTSIPKGTRDFSPLQMRRRQYIFETIRKVFALHAYLPIETPAMESLSTLMGKYGEEGDKLLFKILNSGDFWAKAAGTPWDEADPSDRSVKLANKISEKGLRYDLTVPFARYVVQHRGDLTLPFKRYQMQPVWRADRPQRGRYREFYQCDADVVGSTSLWQEAELAQMVAEVFKALRIPVTLKINNRKILAGLAEYVGCPGKMVDITVAIDKLDKIGLAAVEAEMAEKGVAGEAWEKLAPVLTLTGSFTEKMAYMRQLFAQVPVGLQGVAELEELFGYIAQSVEELDYEWDLSLARGLNYYTGAIFEVKAQGVEMGSISGGGRYDDLTGIFGMKGLSGVGISFGADRIYDVLESLERFPDDLQSGQAVLFVHFGAEEAGQVQAAMRALRTAGIACDRYPEPAKLQKQFTYADKLRIPYVVMVGERERESGRFAVKDMRSGEQRDMDLNELMALCKP
ncbi:MAG: histidine--tRNA ligase [Bacteroidales bacterium]|nr:histidine--tRNA ligase [Bacteroidales bacterium]